MLRHSLAEADSSAAVSKKKLLRLASRARLNCVGVSFVALSPLAGRCCTCTVCTNVRYLLLARQTLGTSTMYPSASRGAPVRSLFAHGKFKGM